MSTLDETAKQLVTPGKGILAADESFPTIKKRFEAIGLESTEENRKAYRKLLFTTPGIEEYISGVIMFDETIRQGDGKPFTEILSEKGILPGIKVDMGKVEMANFPGEMVTEGLDGLRKRLKEYVELGAKFTKWRAVIKIGEDIPSLICIHSNAENLARFAALSQEAGLVPIVEPEVLMDGDHDIERCREITASTVQNVFSFLKDHKIDYTGMLLKPNMVLPGKESLKKASLIDIATATLEVFKSTVDARVPGLVFLSGGQSPEEATQNLNEINKIRDNAPWQLSFSFGRALQRPVLEAWKGKEENVGTAQNEFLKRARLNSLAREGKYEPSFENSPT